MKSDTPGKAGGLNGEPLKAVCSGTAFRRLFQSYRTGGEIKGNCERNGISCSFFLVLCYLLMANQQ
jgi:hypothetical protein